MNRGEGSRPGLRWLLGALALLTAAFALRPGFLLVPLGGVVAQATLPDTIVPLVRATLLLVALVSAASAVFWRHAMGQLGRLVRWAGDTTPASFWLTAGGVAATLRLAALALPYAPASDALWYHEVAASLAAGNGFRFDGQPTAFRSPGYPFLLSLLYRIGGAHVALAWILGALSTAALLVFLHSVARRLHGEVAARLATLAAAAYPALVIMTGQALSDLVFVAALFGLLAWTLRTHPFAPGSSLLLGVAVGLLTLVRTVGIGMVVLVPAAWWLRKRDTPAFLRSLVLVAVGCGATLVPWMARNEAVLGSFVIGTNGGSNLLVGNRPGASGFTDRYRPPSTVLSVDGEVARDDAMQEEAFRFVLTHPLDAALLVPRKILALYMLETEAVTSAFQGARSGPRWLKSALQALSQLLWAGVALLVAVSVSRWRLAEGRPEGEAWVGWWLVFYVTAIAAVFHGEDRYRLPLLPWFLMEASFLLTTLVSPAPRPASGPIDGQARAPIRGSASRRGDGTHS